MKLCPMIVQGMWEYKSPLLQLPHITEENLKYFSSKKVIKLEVYLFIYVVVVVVIIIILCACTRACMCTMKSCSCTYQGIW
jgi:hypothetical protein